jgi:hypothetical protein
MFKAKGSYSLIILALATAFFIFLFSSCSLKSKVPGELRQLDSLHIVLQTKHTQLAGTDTVLLEKALNRFRAFTAFIENNLRDTLLKDEATALQHFYHSGKNLESFRTNRSTLLARMKLVSSQVNKLKQDVENNTIRRDEFLTHFSEEVNACKELISLGEKERDGFSTSLSTFKSNLPAVEELIKKRNNGLLPSEVNTSLDL